MSHTTIRFINDARINRCLIKMTDDFQGKYLRFTDTGALPDTKESLYFFLQKSHGRDIIPLEATTVLTRLKIHYGNRIDYTNANQLGAHLAALLSGHNFAGTASLTLLRISAQVLYDITEGKLPQRPFKNPAQSILLLLHIAELCDGGKKMPLGSWVMELAPMPEIGHIVRGAPLPLTTFGLAVMAKIRAARYEEHKKQP